MSEAVKSNDKNPEIVPHHAAEPDVSLGALAKLSAPIFIANLALMGAATIDTLMTGNLGKEHLAVVALGGATSVMVLFGLVGILQGLSPIVGHHYGARNYKAIGFELSQNLWLAILLGIIGCVLLLQTDFWTKFGGVSGEVARMTSLFLVFSAPGIFASIVSRSFIALNAAVSRPRVTMYVSLLMLACKIPLNCIFMYGWLGFPALGGAGAGLSLAVDAWLALICYIVIYKKDAFYAYKAWLSDEPFVHLCSKGYVDRTEDEVRITVYSNQEEVELFANGVSVGRVKAPDHFFRFTVTNKGETELAAIAGDCRDESRIRKVDNPNESYRLREKGAVLNWFDINEVEGCFSLNDKLGGILDNPEAAAVFKPLMDKLAEAASKGRGMGSLSDGMMKMLRGFTVLRMLSMVPTMIGGAAGITKEELLSLNDRLNRIRK